MGNCIYCNTKAGIFRKKHKECYGIYNTELNNFLDKISFENKQKDFNLKFTKKYKFLKDDNIVKELEIYYSDTVIKFLDDGIISNEEEDYLNNLKEDLNIKNIDSSYLNFVQGLAIRDLTEGKLTKRANIEGEIPFNLMKTEEPIWLFNDVDYYKVETKTRYEGGSSAVSVKVAKGVYLRSSAFKGKKVSYNELEHKDSGYILVTNKHIYFGSEYNSFRVKLEKIISFNPYEDGVGIQRDGLRAKPEIFKLKDGWFIYNLITNLAKL